MTQDERNELVFICSMMSNYSEDMLNKMSDEELTEIYNRNMNADLNL